MMDDVPYEGWPETWNEYGTHVGSADPVTIRVGIYQPNDDPDGFSIALCTSGGRPILLDARAARRLSEYFADCARTYRLFVQRRTAWRQAAARDLVEGAVLSRDQWKELMAVVKGGGGAADRDKLVDLLTACAPAGWTADKPAATQAEEE